MHFRSTALLSLAALAIATPAAVAEPAVRHVPAPHVCEDGSAPVRGGVGEDGHSHQTGKGHQVHGNGFGYGHGCGEVEDGGDGGVDAGGDGGIY